MDKITKNRLNWHIWKEFCPQRLFGGSGDLPSALCLIFVPSRYQLSISSNRTPKLHARPSACRILRFTAKEKLRKPLTKPVALVTRSLLDASKIDEFSSSQMLVRTYTGVTNEVTVQQCNVFFYKWLFQSHMPLADIPHLWGICLNSLRLPGTRRISST